MQLGEEMVYFSLQFLVEANPGRDTKQEAREAGTDAEAMKNYAYWLAQPAI